MSKELVHLIEHEILVDCSLGVNKCDILRSQTLLTGFQGELNNCKTAIHDAKRQLEVVYSKILGKEDKDIKPNVDLVSEIDSCLGKADSAFTSFAGTYKSIKASIDSQLLIDY